MSAVYPYRRRSPFAPYDPNEPDDMYAPNYGGGGMPQPQQQQPAPNMYGPAQPEQAGPQLFTPPQMPSMSAPTKDVTQSVPIQRDKLQEANATLYGPHQDADEVPSKSIYERYGIKPPNVQPLPEPDFADRMGFAKGYHLQSKRIADMNAADVARAEKEVALAETEQQHQFQREYARNIGTSAPAESQLVATIRDPNVDPATKAWAQEELDKAKRFSQPPAKDAVYVRSVEVINGKPKVIFRNNNDPTDFHEGGSPAPHEFAPATTQISFTPTGQPVLFDPRKGTIGSPTIDPNRPFPEPADAAPNFGNVRAGTEPPPPPGSQQPAPPQKGILPQGPYTKGGQSQTAMTRQEAREIAEAIKTGKQPPALSGFGRNGAGMIKAALAQDGFDLSRAETDWRATQKHIATLNGTQQTRLQQAIVTASESLGVIEDLAKQWDGGGFPILNRAQLALAKNGVLGPQAQQIATNLQAQITDVTSELGNIYMGGNSPTDHALALAQKNLSADWNRDQLLSAVKLARTNIAIRRNSITTSQAVGVSPGSPYSPQMREEALPTGPAGGGTFKYTATGKNGEKVGSNDGKTWTPLK